MARIPQVISPGAGRITKASGRRLPGFEDPNEPFEPFRFVVMADTQFGLGPIFKQMKAAFEKRAAKGQAMPAAWGEDTYVSLGRVEVLVGLKLLQIRAQLLRLDPWGSVMGLPKPYGGSWRATSTPATWEIRWNRYHLSRKQAPSCPAPEATRAGTPRSVRGSS